MVALIFHDGLKTDLIAIGIIEEPFGNRYVKRFNNAPIGQHNISLYRIFQFADIAGPIILQERGLGRR